MTEGKPTSKLMESKIDSFLKENPKYEFGTIGVELPGNPKIYKCAFLYPKKLKFDLPALQDFIKYLVEKKLVQILIDHPEGTNWKDCANVSFEVLGGMKQEVESGNVQIYDFGTVSFGVVGGNHLQSFPNKKFEHHVFNYFVLPRGKEKETYFAVDLTAHYNHDEYMGNYDMFGFIEDSKRDKSGKPTGEKLKILMKKFFGEGEYTLSKD